MLAEDVFAFHVHKCKAECQKKINIRKEIRTLKDLATITRFYCGCGHEMKPMVMGAGRQYDPVTRKYVNLSMMWVCPNRFLKSDDHPEGREGGPACRNSFTVNDYEKILLCISDKCSAALLNYEEPDLTSDGVFTPPNAKHLHCCVIRHTDERIDVSVRNGKQCK